MGVFYNAAKKVAEPVIRLAWKPTVTGMENLPTSGGFIVASNHLAYVDSFVIPVVFPRPVRFVSKDDYWKMPGIKGRIVRWFFNAVGAVPLDRAALSSGKGALQAALGILKENDGFGIYPEGTRSKDGLLHEGKPGAAWLAMESGCPVVPVGLKGTPELFAKGWWPRRGVVSIHVGTPIDTSLIAPEASGGARRRLITQRIMDEIQALSGQERAPKPQRP